jgi:hypothetical protein
MKPHRGVLVLVFGILGLVVCPFFGIAAWVMGNTDLQEMDFGQMESSGRDFTRVGRICGIVATALLAFQVLVIILVMMSVAVSDH